VALRLILAQRSGPGLERLFPELPPQYVVEAATYQIRHRKKLAIAVKLDGFDGRVIHDFAMGASAEMFMQNAP
jgi:hypothetical protein